MVYVENTGKKEYLASIIVFSILQVLYAEFFQTGTGNFKGNQNMSLIQNQKVNTSEIYIVNIQQESQYIMCITRLAIILQGTAIGLDLLISISYFSFKVMYEPMPKEYIYDEDEELQCKNDEELPENVWNGKVFSRVLAKIGDACLVFWRTFCKILD
nr:13183_t:CDS:2 [Entrophospora candida]